MTPTSSGKRVHHGTNGIRNTGWRDYCHIEHIADLAGGSLDNIAIGTDMDGGFGAEVTPTDVDTIADLQGFADVLRGAGISESDIAGILHGNALRMFRRAWS